MGKEWYWSGKSSKRTTSSNNNGQALVDRESDNRNSSSTTTGCMCAVFQLFDFPQLHFAPNLHHNHNETTPPLFKPITRNNTTSSSSSTTNNATFQLPEEEPNLPKGTEAPRNSLNKSEEENSLSSIIEDEELVESFHNIQMGMNQIKTITTTPSSKSADFSSDTTSCSSPATTGAKTPSLVARLMGLDLLPETNSPTHNNNNNTTINKHQNHTKKPHHHYYSYTHSSLRQNVREPSGTRSLPETPRPSASRRSDVDANHHHRLSLQLNKENSNNYNSLVFSQDLDLSSRLCSSLRRSYYQNDDEEACYYARKAVRQAKESVVAARKAACLSDITNNARESKSSSSSPRLKACAVREQVKRDNKGSGKMKEETFVFGPMTKKTKKKKTKKKSRDYGESTKSGHNSYKRANINIPDSKIIKRKRIASDTSSSKDLLNGLKNVVVPTLVSVKKKKSGSNTNNGDYDQLKVPHKSQSRRAEVITQMSTSHLSSCQSQRSRHVSGKNDAVRHYITKILGRTGISATSHVSFTNWFSPSHPLDPSIFHRLELHYSNNIYLKNSHQHLLSPTSNRKLVFDVVDQLLVEILRPCINLKPWTIMNNNIKNNNNLNYLSFYCNVDDQVPARISNAMQGKDLIETLCTRVEGFPCKDCQVLEDIDALIDQDLCDHHIAKAQNEIAFEEESEALVMEIEKDIVDTLVHETALFFMGKIPTFF